MMVQEAHHQSFFLAPPARCSSQMKLLDLGNLAVRRMLVARGVSSQTAQVLGHDVHYYRAEGTGKGPPLFLVHGLGSSANAFFRTVVPLAKQFRSVYAIDLPGNGFSPLPSTGPLPLRQYIEVLRQFRRQIIGEKVFLIGNSLGGAMAFYYAHEEPDALEALALISPAGAKVAPGRLAMTMKSFDVTTHKEARGLARKLFAKPSLGLLVFAGELRHMVSSPAVKSIRGEVKEEDLVSEEMLAALKMPTLLIWGQQEKLLPYESIDYYRAHLPKSAEVHEVRAFGHMPQMEHPREFVMRINAFAQSQGLF